MPPAAPPAPPPAPPPTWNASRPPGAASPNTAGVRRVVKPREKRAIVPKIVFMAEEGFGKTTFGAYAPSPMILMSPGETGYDTLLSAGTVPQCPAEEVRDWPDLMGWCDSLLADPQGIQTLVLDELGGLERLCHNMVCARDYKGDFEAFMSFHKGYEVAVRDWRTFMAKLEQLNARHAITIVVLSHVRKSAYRNPVGQDYDRFSLDVHDKTTGAEMRGWADAILFGRFRTIIEHDKKNSTVVGKGKGIGGTDRVIYTERRDAWDAKNRYRMPFEIDVAKIAPEQMWATVWNLITNTQP